MEDKSASTLAPQLAPEFWKVVEVLEDTGLLPHLMIVGSWAEYIYAQAYGDQLLASFRTQDVDILVPNIRIPKKGVNIYAALADKGFVYDENIVNGVGKKVPLSV
ncbi:MAG: nucleotidyltransferase domain-containing protein [Coriobacteriia bacterium]|nr:nucleotidyltransferase domain-containing protein [Coriobacteriia bacterium]MCL2537238.1 nucleotidyltransferase domain-containing protein [Coriobacteriia bacterium]